MLRPRLVLPLLLLGLAAPAAHAADPVVLAPAPEAAGITAQDGHVVVSRRDPATGLWSLVRWHAGVVDVLPVAPRAVPFDADAGTDADGDPVLVYSRCRQDPPAPEGLPPAADWQLARGCDLWQLPLTGTAQERRLEVPGDERRSETTPSMWRGTLAFARHRDGADTPAVEVLPHGSKRLRVLGAGSVQSCTRPCTDGRHQGVTQLDAGPSRVAYLWQMQGSAVYGTGLAWELRAAPLSGGSSVLLDDGLISGTCGFGLPAFASASRSPIAYLDAGSPCDVTQTRFATADPVTGAIATAPTPGGLAAGMARDGSTLYWLRVTGDTSRSPVPGARSCALATCELVASPLPSYEPAASRGHFPPAFTDVARSGQGFRWVRGPLGTELLRPPSRLPCAPSRQAAQVPLAARWTSGRRSVRVVRTDRRGSRRAGSVLTHSAPDGNAISTRLLRCGDSARVTYVVSHGRATRRVSFTVSRARLRS